ncbi:MAG TPA: hypothetical protein VIM16_20985 [Mucilaginibacter sp.]|jgi:hypothetical protein
MGNVVGKGKAYQLQSKGIKINYLKKVYKITYKTYLNERLKQVDFHGQLTHPLYVQVTFERKTIFFKSYYFELFSKPRYFLIVPGAGSKGPSLEQVIEKETEVVNFILNKFKDDFSLEKFKTAYAYYSKDLCDITEKGFIDYLYTFFWDKGSPHIGDLIKWGGSHVVAYDLLKDFKRTFNKTLYDELVENSFYYAPPYLPVYGYMQQTKRWPMLCLTMMEWDRAETKAGFKEYAEKNYPNMNSTELIGQVNNWPNYRR